MLGSEEDAVPVPTASREDNLAYDLKNMAAYDISPMSSAMDVAAYSRDSVQLLINKLFMLPRTQGDEGTMVSLPAEETFRLPRSKPIPKEKPKTRWQKFMEERNMKKRKRSRLVWDEIEGDWKPRWGYKSIKKSQDKANWVHEVGQHEDPNENPFDKAKAEQRLVKARQKMREVRNQVEAAGGKLRASVPDLVGSQKRGKDGLREAVKRAQVSSASYGKFDRIAPNEATNLQPTRKKGIAPVSSNAEKDSYLKTVGRVLSGDGYIDKHKAAKAWCRSDNTVHETRDRAVRQMRQMRQSPSLQPDPGALASEREERVQAAQQTRSDRPQFVNRSAQEHLMYIQEKVNPVLEALVTAVLLERPDDPSFFMLRWLCEQTKSLDGPEQGGGQRASSIAEEIETVQAEIKKLKERKSELQTLLGLEEEVLPSTDPA
ncbi:RRS1 [Symbiodinium sp. CCMP2456]|nr:RRS1 [Symbiodinium sp. CCMP2456]